MINLENKLHVNSEIGTLQRVLIHSPDSGLGKVVPSKAQDWLFEDIVHLETIRRKEYDYYVKLLLYFLDPIKIKGKLSEIDDPNNNFDFYKPHSPKHFKSENVVELQCLLAEILEDKEIKTKLVASVCAIENCSYAMQMDLKTRDAVSLANIFICGSLPSNEMIFPPVPNFIFTRDIGITINEHILLNKPAKKARTREALLAKYIFFNHPFFANYKDKIIELPNVNLHFLLPEESEEETVTLEGGDVMMVAKNHLLIGVSERTTTEAAYQSIKALFEKDVVQKISILRIPKKRDYMHIDTIFTQVKRNMWVLLGIFSKKNIDMANSDAMYKELVGLKKDNLISISQFHKSDLDNPIHFNNLEDLLVDISTNDLGCSEPVKFLYSGNNEFPFDAREQWTDSCNLLCLKEGVVLGYDRNEKTLDAFTAEGFSVITAHELLQKLETGDADVDTIKNTFITMPSAELSRARGGFHCMSMPLLRKEIND